MAYVHFRDWEYGAAGFGAGVLTLLLLGAALAVLGDGGLAAFLRALAALGGLGEVLGVVVFAAAFVVLPGYLWWVLMRALLVVMALRRGAARRR